LIYSERLRKRPNVADDKQNGDSYELLKEAERNLEVYKDTSYDLDVRIRAMRKANLQIGLVTAIALFNISVILKESNHA
jgi:hypothetical protein